MIEHITTEAGAVSEELKTATRGTDFPQLKSFTQRFRHEFHPHLFQDIFWTRVGTKLGLREYACGARHHLFFAMREKYRLLEKYPVLDPKEQKDRYPEVINFLEAVASTEHQ